MAHTPLTPVFVGLRAGLHGLFGVLTLLVVVRALVSPTGSSAVVAGLAALLLLTYVAGRWVGHGTGRSRGWLAILTVEWVVLLGLSPEAAYLVFPLFFLFLHLLGRVAGSIAILVSTVVAIVALGWHGGWSVGGIVGPLVGAGVALLIGLGYQALAREASEREALLLELIATRDRLAETQHEAGVLAERSRLAREIHDTVAQGLSSIQILLHAAERSDPEQAGIDHLRLARETAAANLADTRRFIRALTPPDLDDRRLGGALRRLASTEWASHGLPVTVRVPEALELPMPVQTALLRIAQGAVANVIQHADASGADISLEIDRHTLTFTVTDDGCGFDPDQVQHVPSHPRSFGLRATRERVDQLGGLLVVESAPGRGTTVQVELDLDRSTGEDSP